MKTLANRQLEPFFSIFAISRDLKLICISAFAFAFGDGLFSFLLPVYMNQLGASPTEVGVLYAAYYLTLGITLLIGGFLADHVDKKKIIIAGALLWVPVPLAITTAADWNQLWVPMILYGTFFGATSVSLYVLRSSSPEKTMRAFGLWSASVALGYVFSPLIGGFLSTIIGKQDVFYLAATLYGVSILPFVFLSQYKDKPQKRNTIFNYAHKPVNSGPLIILCLFFSTIIFAIFLITPLIPQFTNNVYNYSVTNIGFFGTLTFSGWFIFSFILGKIGDQHSKMTAVLTSTALCCISYFLILTFNFFPLLSLAFFLSGASRCIIGFVPAIIGSAAPDQNRGRWISIGQTAVNFASFGAPILGGTLYQVSPYLAFLTTISLLLILTFIAKIKRY